MYGKIRKMVNSDVIIKEVMLRQKQEVYNFENLIYIQGISENLIYIYTGCL